jgi:hypothetical protein
MVIYGLMSFDFNESGGWAGLANLSIGLSDFGTVNLAGKVVTAGFGGIEQSLMERSMNNDYQYNAAAMLQLGKFFPEKTKVSIPLYISVSQELTQPKYNPLDQDILLSDALNNATSAAERDSIKSLSQTWQTTKSFNITNAKIDIRSKEPKLYDPANFSLSYIYNETSEKDPTTIYSFTKNYQGTFNYTFSTAPKPWEPFKKNKKLDSPFLKWLAEFNLNFTPSLIAYNTNITRTYTQSQLRDFDLDLGMTQSKYDLLSLFFYGINGLIFDMILPKDCLFLLHLQPIPLLMNLMCLLIKTYFQTNIRNGKTPSKTALPILDDLLPINKYLMFLIYCLLINYPIWTSLAGNFNTTPTTIGKQGSQRVEI